MKIHWKQKTCALLTATMMLSSTMVGLSAQVNTHSSQSAPEEVLADIIGDGQRSTLFNENWKFHRGDVNDAKNTNYNDSSWDTVNLPHDYSIDQNFTVSGEAESGFLPGGIGMYRKSFVVPNKYKDKKLMIEFDGAYMNAEVYLNGVKLGEHPYGYTAFAFDITKGLVCDGQTENVITVKTNNKIPSSRWYSGSGIYRDVKLTVTDKVHVAYNGTQIIAKDLESTKNSTVNVDVKTKIQNDTNAMKTVTVKNTLLDKNGKVSSNTVTNEVEVGEGGTKDIKQTVQVTSPKLWSVKEANIYTMKTEVMDGNKVIDTYQTKYGFRHYNFDKNTGFSLNGENMKLKGVCMHHDQGALGAVASRDAIERQVKILKDMGCNAIRVTHNPAASALLDVCDEYGILVIDEAFDGWTQYKNGNSNDYTSHFNETITADNQIVNGEVGMKWGEFDVKSMVDGAKNNPSVIMWSLGNEIDEGVSGSTSHYASLVEDIIGWVKDIDITRPVTNGDNRKSTDASTTINQVNKKIYEAGGVVGMNYANASQANSMHSTFGNWPLYGAETASAVHSRGVYSTFGKDDVNLQMSDYDNDQAKVGWGHSASNAWDFVIKNDFNAGEFVWTGFDYIGEPTPWNGTGSGSVSGQGAKPKSSYFGIVDTAGFAKDTYYLYKSLWDEKTTTLNLMSTWNNNEIVKDGSGKVKVDVYTNAAKVELYLNGNKVAEDTATTHTTGLGYTYQTFTSGKAYPSFNVTWASGTLSAKAYDKEGRLITNTVGRSSVSTNTAATQLDTSVDKKEINADGKSLSYITVDVKDASGNIVAGATNRINFEIKGNGKIVGVDNGNAADTDSYKGNSRKAFSGKALVIVQSTKEAGEFTLTASSEGLSSSSETIKTIKNTTDGESFLKSYKISKNLYVGIGEEPTLSNQVVGTYNNGDTKNLSITWNSYNKDLLSKPGEFIVTGKLQDSDVIVTVNIHVIGEIVAMENYSTVTSAEVLPTLPQSLRGIYNNGAYSEAFPVQWNISKDDVKNEGIVTIKGTVSVLNETKEVTATIRITPKLAESQNIASNSYSGVPTFKNGKMLNGTATEPSSSAISDSLLNLNNGITNNGADEPQRWTNWSLKNDNPVTDTYLQLEWQKEHTMQNIKLWHFTDNQFSVLPGDTNVRFEYYDSLTSTWRGIESSHITQVPYTSGDTPYGFINPITTSKLRVWIKAPQVGKCIGLTEIEVYDYIKPIEANKTASLDELKLDGIAIDKFDGYKGYDAATKTYTIDLRTNKASKMATVIPEIIAKGNNNEAITIVPFYNNQIKIMVKSEDGLLTETYTIQFILPVKKDELNQYITSNEIVTAFNSAHQYIDTTYQAFFKVYNQALEILKDDNATQEQVDNIYNELETAYKGLQRITENVVQKDILASIIEKAEQVKESDFNNIEKTIVEEFKTALKEAKDIYNNKNVTQDHVDASVTRLTKALDNLKVTHIDKTSLQALVNQASSLRKNDYTVNSWKVLEKSLTEAKDVLGDKKASVNKVLEAETSLRNALNQLKKREGSMGSSDGVETSDITSFIPIVGLGISVLIILLFCKRKEKE